MSRHQAKAPGRYSEHGAGRRRSVIDVGAQKLQPTLAAVATTSNQAAIAASFRRSLLAPLSHAGSMRAKVPRQSERSVRLRTLGVALLATSVPAMGFLAMASAGGISMPAGVGGTGFRWISSSSGQSVRPGESPIVQQVRPGHVVGEPR